MSVDPLLDEAETKACAAVRHLHSVAVPKKYMPGPLYAFGLCLDESWARVETVQHSLESRMRSVMPLAWDCKFWIADVSRRNHTPKYTLYMSTYM